MNADLKAFLILIGPSKKLLRKIRRNLKRDISVRNESNEKTPRHFCSRGFLTK